MGWWHRRSILKSSRSMRREAGRAGPSAKLATSRSTRARRAIQTCCSISKFEARPFESAIGSSCQCNASGADDGGERGTWHRVTRGARDAPARQFTSSTCPARLAADGGSRRGGRFEPVETSAGAPRRRRNPRMKPAPYGPFPYSPIIRRPVLTWPDGARVALWIIPNIEFFSLGREGAGGGGRQRCAGAGRAGLVGARLWQPGRGVPADGGARPPRHPRHGRAQQRAVRPASGHHRGGQPARLGMDGPQREQYAPAQRGAAGRGSRHHRAHPGHHRGRHRDAAGRLARRRPAGDLGHARPAGGAGLRICRRLGQ